VSDEINTHRVGGALIREDSQVLHSVRCRAEDVRLVEVIAVGTNQRFAASFNVVCRIPVSVSLQTATVTAQRNVKVRNLSRDNRVSHALLNAGNPIVAEGRATIVRSDLPERVVIGFADKCHNWDVRSTEPDGPRILLRVTVDRWLFTGSPR
jgi:hypothetical protein